MKALKPYINPDYYTSQWRWSLIVICIVISLLTIRKNPMEFTYINSDGHGYYGHLPAVFIYQDLHFGFIDQLQNSGLKHTAYIDDYRRTVDGGIVNITYIGVAILWIPFFLLAHVFALITSFEANGYSTPYQISVLFAAISYLLLGLWAFGMLLQRYNIKAWIISLLLVMMVFATSTLYYVLDQPAFTHVYTLALFSVFLLSFHKFFQDYKLKYLWLGMVVLGLLGIIRPVNAAMVLALPLLAGSWERFWQFILWMLKNPVKILGPIAVLLGILFIQPLVYFIQTSHFFVWSYQGASFDFTNPQFRNILISYEKGLFVYTPILLFTFIGLFKLWFVDRYMLLWLVISLFVPLYILASWWNWWFGMSFGHRGFIDYYPLFFLAIAFGLQYLQTRILRHFVIFTCIILLAFNYIQLYQYRNYIHYWLMDKDMYWRVFLRTSIPYFGFFWEDEKYENAILALHNAYPVKKWHTHIGYENPSEQTDIEIIRGMANTGVFSARLAPENLYRTIFTKTVADEIPGEHLAVVAHVSVNPLENPIQNPVFFIVKVDRNQETILWLNSSTRRHNVFSRQWNRINIADINGFHFQPGDVLSAYFYNPHNNTVYWDDFSLFLFGHEN